MSKENFSIKRILYKHINISIEFFTYRPNILVNKNSYTINVNPVVIFRYVNTNNMDDTKVSYSENAYKMTQKNQAKIIKFFQNIVDWFYDKDLKDLFLINESDELIFNSDYLHINSILSKGKYDVGLMKAVPSVIVIEEKKYEGIYLYINKFDNFIMLTKEDVEEILNIVKNFNFINETASLLSIIDYSERNNSNIITDFVEWNRITRGSSNGVKYISPFG